MAGRAAGAAGPLQPHPWQQQILSQFMVDQGQEERQWRLVPRHVTLQETIVIRPDTAAIFQYVGDEGPPAALSNSRSV